jgi:hypothetical protein
VLRSEMSLSVLPYIVPPDMVKVQVCEFIF